MASALNGDGTDDVWETVTAHLEHLDEHDLRSKRRQHRIRTEVRARLGQAMGAAGEAAMNGDQGAALLADAQAGKVSPNAATNELLKIVRR